VKGIVLAASMMAIAAMTIPLFEEGAAGQSLFRPFNAFDQTVAPGSASPFRYDGGPKRNYRADTVSNRRFI
jgi:hypothetical protein